MFFLTWRPQHLLLPSPTTRSATSQSKGWRMVPAYSATSTRLTNGVISGKWILINPSAGYFLLPSQLSDVQVKTMEAQEDLVVLVTRHLKWNSQVQVACSKANRMLGFIRRSAFDTHEQRVCKLLYTSLVRSKLAYCSQVLAPQAVNLILDIERIQRRATKFTLSLPYRSEVRYKQRLLKTMLLPLSYWHEILDMVYVFKCLVSLSDPFISVMNSTRLRRTVSSKDTLLNTVRSNTGTLL